MPQGITFFRSVANLQFTVSDVESVCSVSHTWTIAALTHVLDVPRALLSCLTASFFIVRFALCAWDTNIPK